MTAYRIGMHLSGSQMQMLSDIISHNAVVRSRQSRRDVESLLNVSAELGKLATQVQMSAHPCEHLSYEAADHEEARVGFVASTLIANEN